MNEETAARISAISAELNAKAISSFIEVQGMMALNEERRRNGKADAYDEVAFLKLRDILDSYIGDASDRIRNCQ